MTALPRSLDEARALEAAGARMKFLYFWGHQPSRDGSPGPGCLSQWWDSPFSIGDVTYATAEHWMMAQKARLFGDEQAFARIIEAAHPGQAKRLGREVRGFDEQTRGELGQPLPIVNSRKDPLAGPRRAQLAPPRR
jgi:predicted NAD-dependent protein-ADP-ribosyltransferase YbiA (DUF1768 family)